MKKLPYTAPEAIMIQTLSKEDIITNSVDDELEPDLKLIH